MLIPLRPKDASKGRFYPQAHDEHAFIRGDLNARQEGLIFGGILRANTIVFLY